MIFTTRLPERFSEYNIDDDSPNILILPIFFSVIQNLIFEMFVIYMHIVRCIYIITLQTFQTFSWIHLNRITDNRIHSVST
jgi:hypothetical protein